MRIFRPHDLGTAIRARRHVMGWSQAELATRAGVSRVWLARLETGKHRADLSLVLRLVEALGLRLELMEEEAPGPHEVAAAPVDLDGLLERYGQG